jgi:Leucine rich repeat
VSAAALGVIVNAFVPLLQRSFSVEQLRLAFHLVRRFRESFRALPLLSNDQSMTTSDAGSVNTASREVFVPFAECNDGTPQAEVAFITEADGLPVLDSNGRKIPIKKWKAVSHGQKERYQRMQAALKGDTPAAKWLHSQVLSPQLMRVPEAPLHETSTAFRGRGFGESARQASTFLETLRARAWAAGSRESPESNTSNNSSSVYDTSPVSDAILAKRRAYDKAMQPPKARAVDGFVLLEGAGVELPDNFRRSDISGGNFSAVVQSDLNYFQRLAELDAGDNSLPFDAFCTLPRLQELRLQCNHISSVPILPLTAYPALQRLDLSYNSLGLEAVAALTQLLQLRSLDLTCNGLTAVPPELARLQCLEKLVLERNQLEGADVLAVLATLPALRELSLAFNYFAVIEFASTTTATIATTAADQQQQQHLSTVLFPMLDTLDLAFNYIAAEADAMGLIALPKLARVLLYGNPLCGPSGEDTLGLCVDDLLVASDRAREGWGTAPLDAVTEMPRQQRERAKMRSSRRRPYSDACVTLLVEAPVPKASAFKAAGNQAVFQVSCCVTVLCSYASSCTYVSILMMVVLLAV